MDIFALGLNHKTTSLALRERVGIAERDLPQALDELRQLPGLSEGLLLSTCNRVEVYGATESYGQAPADEIIAWLERHFNISPDERGALKLYCIESGDAARHLFRVVSGMDSMVLGETEIFGQVKRAYQAAQQSGTTGGTLNRLFQRAFRIGKTIRSESRIQHGATSVGAVAVELAARMFGDLSQCRVMVLGAGEQSRITAQSLVSRGASQLFVSNRSFDKASELADEMGGRAVRFDAWDREISAIDIVISSTTAPHYVLRPEHVEKAVHQRRGRPLFLIDIAVPRDIDPAVDRYDDVYLYDLDNLEAVAAQGRKERAAQLGHCEAMIERFVHEYLVEESNRVLRLDNSPVGPAPGQSPPRSIMSGGNSASTSRDKAGSQAFNPS